jgi:hypothetical protein
MGKSNRLSHDQKRKAKLKKRAEHTGNQESLAYKGNKYKTPELTPFLFRTEVAIHEANVLTQGDLQDDAVEAALGDLITQLRQGPLPDFSQEDTLPIPIGPDKKVQESLVVKNILRNWRIWTEQHTLPRKDDIIGVLRTILNSLEFWRYKNMHPQGYLRFLEGFLKEAGVSVKAYPSNPLPFLECDDEDEPEDEDEP